MTAPYALAYAADVVLPIVDFGLSDSWTVTGLVQWMSWVAVALGWILTTLTVAAFSQAVRNP